jgi:alpha-maltose-1-phosphate synthase
MNLLLLSSEYPPRIFGGLGVQVHHLVEELRRYIEKIDVFVRADIDAALVERENVDVYFCDCGPTRRDMFTRVRTLQSADRIADRVLGQIKQSGKVPDLIHCHEWFMYPTAERLASNLRVPVVSTVHLGVTACRYWGEDPTTFAVEQERAMCRESDGVITVSNAMAELLVREHDIKIDRVAVIHNGLPMEFPAESIELCRLQIRRLLGIPAETPLIVYAGRLVPQKGILDLLRSAVDVIRQHRDVLYLIVGDRNRKDYFKTLLDFVDQHSLKKHVRFLGRLHHEGIQLLYGAADLAVVPSVYEPFGYSAIEAMSAGVPIIASDCGGLSEIVEHDVSGFLVPMVSGRYGTQRCDIGTLARATLKLLGSDKLRKEMGFRGAERIRKCFLSEQMAAKTIAFYQQVLIRTDGRSAESVIRIL